MLNIDLDEKTILAIVVVLVILYWVYTQRTEKKEKCTMLAGAPQEWGPLDYPREESRCDTDYNDDECKFSAINCVNNPNSYFYQNE